MKTFVIDTNVLIHRPDAIFTFEDNNVVIPLEVIEELDKLKTEHHSGRGRSAREAGRILDKLIQGQDVKNGVEIPQGGTLFIPVLDNIKSVKGLKETKKDNTIILTALEFMKCFSDVIFVSKDINARIKAEALGIKSQDYENQSVPISDQYTGIRHIETTQEVCWELRDMKSVEIEGEFYANEYCCLSSPEASTIFIGKYDKDAECFRLVDCASHGDICGVSALNIEQSIALDALLDPKINLVTITGPAGTGKTLLACAVGLQQVLQDKIYNKVVVARPIVPMGNELGFLPGDIEQKLSPWLAPIVDNLEYIIDHAKKQNLKSIDLLKKNKVIQLEALTYIRGRSLPEQFIIVDEAQNLTAHEIKTIVTRAGKGTKVIFTGDIHQIDNPYLDSTSNGLIRVVEAFKGEAIATHITLEKTERSELAELATKLL